MRFRAPRSTSPSPVRQQQRHRSTFGLQSDSEESSSSDIGTDSDYSDSDSDESVISSGSSDSFCYASESEVPKLAPKFTRETRNPAEQRKVEETVAAIRLRTRHHDPYEDWERQTRFDAFRTARKELKVDQKRFHEAQDKNRTAQLEGRAAQHARQIQEMEVLFEKLRMKAKQEEEQLLKDMKARQAKMWEGIEGVIKAEEEIVRARLAQEAKQREEEEKKREQKKKEEEAARKAKEEKELAEKRAKEEEARKAEEEKQKMKEREEQAALLKQAKEREEAQQQELRQITGMTSPDDDWKFYHAHLEATKRDTMKSVKADKGARTEWSKWRREFTSKIGQLTSDSNEINRISQEIFHIVCPRSGPAHHPAIYKALLYSLAKTIILQAETEVTAEMKSAVPIAAVAFNLLEAVKDFDEVFFTKLVHRAGAWPIPYLVPSEQSSRARQLAMGFREDGDQVMETLEAYSGRMSGIMRVYFTILKSKPSRPLHPAFQLPRFWTWLTRLLKNKELLELPVAPQLIYTALDAMDIDGRKIWGHQFNKLLELIYEGVTTGYEAGKLIGGTTPEAVAARSRVQTVVERLLSN